MRSWKAIGTFALAGFVTTFSPASEAFGASGDMFYGLSQDAGSSITELTGSADIVLRLKNSAPTTARALMGWCTSTADDSGASNVGVYGRADSPGGRGIYGYAAYPLGSTADAVLPVGVMGVAEGFGGRGVVGDARHTSGETNGVWGWVHSPNGRGVYGLGDAATGSAVGVMGRSNSASGRGVYGVVGAAGAYGVMAQNTTANNGGVALRVIGRAMFSTQGKSQFSSGTSSRTVSNTAVTSNSHISVVFTSNPGSAVVKYIKRTAGSGFTVYLTTKVSATTTFTYLITEPSP